MLKDPLILVTVALVIVLFAVVGRWLFTGDLNKELLGMVGTALGVVITQLGARHKKKGDNDGDGQP